MNNTLYLQQGSGCLAYDVIGAGPLVVCVPGMGDLRAEYRLLAPRLVAAGYRVATLDVRGHGESSVEWDDFSVAGVGSDILALIRALGAGVQPTQPALVIGTSMAAGAAVWAAAEGPELVNGIALLGPAVRGEVHGASRALYRLLFSRPWGPSLWKRYYTTLFPTHKPDDFAEYSDAIVANLKQNGRMEALCQMMLASKTSSEERLERVQVPALVLMGSKDPDFKDPEAEARLLAGKLKANYHMIAGTGHYPQVESLDAVLPLLLPFLAEITRD